MQRLTQDQATMDMMRDLNTRDAFAFDPETEVSAANDTGIDAPPAIGTDERRMHVRAYNYWVGLLDGRVYPSIEDLDPESNGDFGPHSVLIDFTRGQETPSIGYLGAKLAAECNMDGDDADFDSVPPRSLLSRLTDHYLQIIANRAPIGFEAEFVNARGNNTSYRGILMPFSSDDDTIDFIYGVINWKEVAAPSDVAALRAQVAGAMTQPRPAVAAWADGPHAADARPVLADPGDAAPATLDLTPDDILPADPEGEGLADWLAAARASADAVKHADGRSRAALYHALGHAYDFALLAEARGDEYAELLADTGLVAQDRAPMTPIVKLVFGHDYDKTRLTEFAAALAYGKRNALPKGGMRVFLDHYPGGLKAVVAAERRERRPEGKVAKPDTTREAARAMEPQAILTLPGDDEFIVMVARRLDPDRVAVIGVAPEDKALLQRALKYVVAGG